MTTTRAALLAGFVGLGALGTFWLNSRVYQITARTFELTERGHLTDRYTKAIEQLGDDNLDVRLGGIYALEQLATDSPRDRDQATIVEVLSAFVRVHSDPLYQYKASLPKDEPPEPTEQQRQKAAEYVAERKRPPVDVQGALTVLGRLPPRPRVQRADLGGAHLTGARLGGANLTGADLGGANLTGARLGRANLTGARLGRANLTVAILRWADLTEADLGGANLTGAELGEANVPRARLGGADLTEADLGGANLIGADLGGANLTGARLGGANLTGARLGRANLTEADLLRADLTKADLGRADLTGAYLGEANLTGAILGGANLTGADLGQANLTKADLGQANLTEADLGEANLTGAILRGAFLGTTVGLAHEQLDGAIGDGFTVLPAGLRRPESW